MGQRLFQPCRKSGECHCRLFIQLAALSGREFELGDVGVIAGVGDRLVFTQPLFWQAVLESLPEPAPA